MRALPAVLVTLCVTLASLGCGEPPRAPSKDGPDALSGPGEFEFSVPGFEKRPYLLHLPPGYAPGEEIPLVVAIHGGGGNARSALKVSCKGGSESDPSCLTMVGEREGFAVVAPSGTGNIIMEEIRTWNAGGGQDDWQCVSGDGCKNAVDDVPYFDALHEEMVRALDIDLDRVYATGLSNGGAMSHRLACERSMRFAAVASVGGGNQLAQVQGCTPGRAMSVMEIHGTEDPCWTYKTSGDACAQTDGMKKVGVKETIDGWKALSGCTSEPEEDELNAVDDDGTSTLRRTHACLDDAEVVELKVDGGGHTWPGGDGYFNEGRIGKVSQDYNASDIIWDFFKKHPLP